MSGTCSAHARCQQETTSLNVARVSTDGEVTMRMKTYLVAYRDPDRNEYEYVLRARSRRRARADAKRSVGIGRIDWDATLVSVTPFPPPGRTRRLLSVAGVTFVAAGTTILAATIVALSLQGAV